MGRQSQLGDWLLFACSNRPAVYGPSAFPHSRGAFTTRDKAGGGAGFWLVGGLARWKKISARGTTTIRCPGCNDSIDPTLTRAESRGHVYQNHVTAQDQHRIQLNPPANRGRSLSTFVCAPLGSWACSAEGSLFLPCPIGAGCVASFCVEVGISYFLKSTMFSLFAWAG